MPTEQADSHLSLGAVRTARVLQSVANDRWSLSGLARELGLERRTLGRVVNGLEREGFVARGRAGRLIPGPRFVAVARIVSRQSGVAALAVGVVSDLAQATGCTSMLHQVQSDYLRSRTAQVSSVLRKSPLNTPAGSSACSVVTAASQPSSGACPSR